MATADDELVQAELPRVAAEVRREPEVNKLFRMVMKHEGSDLHLKVGLPPMMRLKGVIRHMEMRPLTQEDMERLLYPVMSERLRQILEETGGADFAHVVGNDECRFRVNCINQREVGLDVSDWNTALKHAVREDPDIILVGEMRDRDTFEAGINAAETGHLVFGTIHASSASSTIGRILDLFPADMHNAIRQALAFNLKAVVAQKLLPSIIPGVQRVPTNELMIA